MDADRQPSRDLSESSEERLARHKERLAARDQRRIDQETRRGGVEMRKLSEELEADMREEAEEEDAFLRDRIAPMLAEGWTVEELSEIGIFHDLLTRLGLLDIGEGKPNR